MNQGKDVCVCVLRIPSFTQLLRLRSHVLSRIFMTIVKPEHEHATWYWNDDQVARPRSSLLHAL